MKYLTLILLLSSSYVFSIEIEFIHPHLNYQAVISKKKVSMKSELVDVSIKESECNSYTLKSFYMNYLKQSKKLIIDKKNYYTVRINKKRVNVYKDGSFAQYLLNLPRQITSLKGSAMLSCKK